MASKTTTRATTSSLLHGPFAGLRSSRSLLKTSSVPSSPSKYSLRSRINGDSSKETTPVKADPSTSSMLSKSSYKLRERTVKERPVSLILPRYRYSTYSYEEEHSAEAEDRAKPKFADYCSSSASSTSSSILHVYKKPSVKTESKGRSNYRQSSLPETPVSPKSAYTLRKRPSSSSTAATKPSKYLLRGDGLSSAGDLATCQRGGGRLPLSKSKISKLSLLYNLRSYHKESNGRSISSSDDEDQESLASSGSSWSIDSHLSASSSSSAKSNSSPSENETISSTDSSTSSSAAGNENASDTSLTECKRRDAILRPYITNRDWDKCLEFELARNLLINPRREWLESYSDYRYVYDYEWANPVGKGDLIFTDGKNRFLVVELKTMETDIGQCTGRTSQGRRRRKRRQVEEQTETYARQWHNDNPQVKSTIGVFVTEHEIREMAKLPE